MVVLHCLRVFFHGWLSDYGELGAAASSRASNFPCRIGFLSPVSTFWTLPRVFDDQTQRSKTFSHPEKRSSEKHVMPLQAFARAICLPRLGFPFSSALPALGAISTPEGRPFLKCEALKIKRPLESLKPRTPRSCKLSDSTSELFQLPLCCDLNWFATAFLDSGTSEFVARLTLPAFAEFLWSAFRMLRLSAPVNHECTTVKRSA